MENKIRILDLGSGNTCRNNPGIIHKMIDAIAEVDPKRKFILKFQLFQEAPPNIPLSWDCFVIAYDYAQKAGYKTTASVFDKESLNFLLKFDVPFVKLANRPDLYWLIGKVPRKIPVVVSYSHENNFISNILFGNNQNYLCCVSEYPAIIDQYENRFDRDSLRDGISDHTENWQLFRDYRPQIYECHFKLPDSTGPDAGVFARTSQQISEIYEEL